MTARVGGSAPSLGTRRVTAAATRSPQRSTGRDSTSGAAMPRTIGTWIQFGAPSRVTVPVAMTSPAAICEAADTMKAIATRRVERCEAADMVICPVAWKTPPPGRYLLSCDR